MSDVDAVSIVLEEKKTTTLDASKARDAWSETINRAASGKERLILQRRGKPVAAVISVEDLRLLEALVEQLTDQLEEKLDVEEVGRRLSDPNETPRPWAEVKARLGL